MTENKQIFYFLSWYLSGFQILFQILIKSSTACMSSLIFVICELGNFQCRLISDLLVNSQHEKHHIKTGCIIIHLHLRL